MPNTGRMTSGGCNVDSSWIAEGLKVCAKWHATANVREKTGKSTKRCVLKGSRLANKGHHPPRLEILGSEVEIQPYTNKSSQSLQLRFIDDPSMWMRILCQLYPQEFQ
jgi:hypothetical protein